MLDKQSVLDLHLEKHAQATGGQAIYVEFDFLKDGTFEGAVLDNFNETTNITSDTRTVLGSGGNATTTPTGIETEYSGAGAVRYQETMTHLLRNRRNLQAITGVPMRYYDAMLNQMVEERVSFTALDYTREGSELLTYTFSCAPSDAQKVIVDLITDDENGEEE